jgi:endonuclease/exonuclease/phosphatase family metal-dependent hydrolase
MTYNIQIAVSSAHNPKWELDRFNLAGVADIIAAQHPDIVALQEVDLNRRRSGSMDQARWLAERLGYNYVFAPAYHDNENGAYGNALLSRYPIESYRIEHLWQRDQLFPGEPNWVIEPRCCLIAKVLSPEPLWVMATHLSTSPDQQEHQLPQLAALAAECADKPVVLMGDFNTELNQLLDSPVATVLNNLLAAAPAPTYPNGAKARSCIDHIWASSHWQADTVWVVSERHGISDHNPVVADLSLIR